jgi:hypothetical protein
VTSGSSLLEALLAIVLSEKLGDGVRGEGPRAPELEELRSGIRQSLMANIRGGDGATPAAPKGPPPVPRRP